jgi:multiple sugar transport system substrate-binding protein
MEAEENTPSTRRQFLKGAAAVTVATALGGCRDDAPRQAMLAPSQPHSESEVTSNAAATAHRTRQGRQQVRFWHLLNGEWLAPTLKLVERFNQSQSRYEVTPLLVTAAEADSKLLLATAGGDPPDAMLVWTQGTSVWGESGLLQPLDTFMTKEERQRFDTEAYPVISKSGWHKGHLYGITCGFDLFVCYYRADHFRQAGLDPNHFPETLEDLIAAGEKLHRFDASGNLTRLGFLPQTFQYYVAAFGGSFYDEKTKKVTLNTPENLRALEFMVETRRKLGLQKVLRFQSGLSSDTGASWPFINGGYSVTLDGEWRVEQMRQYAPKTEYNTAPLPPPAGGKPLASFSMINYMVIPKGARNSEGAWEFTKFWTGLDNPEAAAEFFPWFGWMPLFPKSAKAPTYEAWLQKVPQFRTLLRVAESENIVTLPPVPYQLYLMDRIVRADDLAMRGTLTPKEALEQLEADVAQELARRKELGYAE